MIKHQIKTPADIVEVRQLISTSPQFHMTYETHSDRYSITVDFRGRSLCLNTGRLQDDTYAPTPDGVVSLLHTRCVITKQHSTIESFAKFWDRDAKPEEVESYRAMYNEWVECLRWSVRAFGANFATSWGVWTK